MTLGRSEEAHRSAPTRAPRFAIQIPLRYRVGDDTEWLKGQIENISRTGVLFYSQGPVRPEKKIELRFVLSMEMDGIRAAEVLCRGRVVRIGDRAEDDSPMPVAVQILGYEFLRAGERPDC